MTIPGRCRLCLAEAELQDSHILPRWAYRRAIKSGNGDSNLVFVRGDVATHGGKQFTEYLLCRPCEQRFGECENAVARIALQVDDRFPAFERSPLIPDLCDEELVVLDASGLDLKALVRFPVSVVWRASISKAFDRVRLGDRYEEQTRRYLLDDSASLPDVMRLSVEFLRPEKLRIDHVVIAPYSARVRAHYQHRFALFGMRFSLFVGQLLPDVFDELCLARTGRVLVSDGTKLLADMAGMFERVRQNGGLRRRRR